SADTTPDIRIPISTAGLIASDPDFNRPEKMFYEVVGRLRPAATVAQAKQESATLFPRVLEEMERTGVLEKPFIAWQRRAGVEMQPIDKGVSALRAGFAGPLTM